MASELGVQTIQHTNGTDAMTIDSSGRVLTPARPLFRVGMTNTTSGSTGGIIILTLLKTNVGNHYNTSGRYIFVLLLDFIKVWCAKNPISRCIATTGYVGIHTYYRRGFCLTVTGLQIILGADKHI